MNTLAAYLHRIDPVAFDLFGLKIRWYGLSYLTGFLLAGLILHTLGRKRRVLIPPQFAMDAIMILIFGVVVGGRLGYVAFYRPELLGEFTSSFPWWGVLAIHKGGMASHGAMIGVLAACWWISRGFRSEEGPRLGVSPMLHIADLACLISLPGLMLGRLANFINGELLGKIVAMPGQPAPWWAVKYPSELGPEHAQMLSPEQAMQYLNLLDSVRTSSDEPEAVVIDRVITRLQHGSADLAARLEPLLSARHPSQLYQAACEGLLLGAILWTVWARPRKPGVLTAWFLLSYGVVRIIIEQYWRLPDPGLDRILGFSRGQWLSMGMLAAGAILLAVAARRPGPRFSWRTAIVDPPAA